MLLSDVIRVRERSQDARAKTLFWLKAHLDGLGSEAQVRVVRELIDDLRKSLREWERTKANTVVQMPVKEPPRAIEPKKR
jgi:hypothetical protein